MKGIKTSSASMADHRTFTFHRAWRKKQWNMPPLFLCLIIAILDDLIFNFKAVNYYDLAITIEKSGVGLPENAGVVNERSQPHISFERTNKTTTKADAYQTKETATSFTFPSREERFRYYMGDWYNQTLHPNDIDCDGISGVNALISDESVLISTSWASRKNQRDWREAHYGRAAFDIVASSGKDVERDFNWFVLTIGDGQSLNDRLPVASKSRYSRFVRRKDTGETVFRSIIWPLNMNRHFGPLNEYIDLRRRGKVAKWEDKKPTLIWRGSATGEGIGGNRDKYNVSTDVPHYPFGQRIDVVKEYFHKNQSIVDVAFPSAAIYRLPDHRKEPIGNLLRGYLRNSHISMEDQLKFKYILSIEGNDVASGLKWKMFSNSVVFMAKATVVSFFMEDLLVPFVHYVPLKDDLSNMVDMVEWARENDDMCRWISDQATKFVNDIWFTSQAMEDLETIKQELGKAYYDQFNDAVKSCA